MGQISAFASPALIPDSYLASYVAAVLVWASERMMQARCCVQIGSLTLRKLRDLEKESGMTGSKDGGSSKKAEPKEEVRS